MSEQNKKAGMAASLLILSGGHERLHKIYRVALPATTVPAAAAVESTTTVGLATARRAAVETAAGRSTSAGVATSADIPVTVITAADISMSTVVSAAAVESAAIVATTPAAVKPGAGADEDAIGEPRRSVIAIGRA
jgi:hypothetical protein